MAKQDGVKLGLSLICLLVLVGCSTGASNQGLVESTSVLESATPLAATAAPTATQEAVIEITAVPTEPPKASAEPGDSEPDPEWVSSADAGNYLGQVVTVRVEVSQCSFRPNVNGSPTFCNDQPYPNHDFTYLMWGVDLSRFDQLCVLVTGEIVEYDGNPQIVVENEEQVTDCDG